MNPWHDYYIRTSCNISSYTLQLALSKSGSKVGDAIDLGCGNGADTCLLVKKGWTVNAIDYQKEALKNTYERISPKHRCRVNFIKEKFENVILPKADLIIANDSLAFCKPSQFAILWSKIENAINIKGRFAGNFFLNSNKQVYNQYSFFQLNDIKKLFSSFDKEIFLEQYEPGPTISGDLWHIIYIVAQKKAFQ